MNWGTGKETVKLKDCGALRDRNSLHTIDMNDPAPGHERGDPESLMIRSVLSARLLELSRSVSLSLCDRGSNPLLIHGF